MAPQIVLFLGVVSGLTLKKNRITSPSFQVHTAYAIHTTIVPWGSKKRGVISCGLVTFPLTFLPLWPIAIKMDSNYVWNCIIKSDWKWKWQSYELGISWSFPVIFSPTTLITSTKLRNWRSFLCTQFVKILIGSKAMT